MAEITPLQQALDKLLAAGHTLEAIEAAVRDIRQQQLAEQLANESATALLKMFNRHSKRRRYAAGGGE
jgi:putative N-acetylmannosamine-6-phosphate epimerase